MKQTRPHKQKQDTDTLEIDWIQEEEHLRNSKELLQKQVLETVSIRFVFVDSESNVLMDTSYKQPLIAITPDSVSGVYGGDFTSKDIVKNAEHEVSAEARGIRGITGDGLPSKVIEPSQSILSKTTLLQCIQTAKKEYIDSILNELDDTTLSVSFSVMDVLIWNMDVETDHLQTYAETLPPEWIGREFTKGNIYEDIVFMPSLCIFHSIQTVYVFLRVSFRKNIPNVSVVSSTAAKKYTRRRNCR